MHLLWVIIVFRIIYIICTYIRVPKMLPLHRFDHIRHHDRAVFAYIRKSSMVSPFSGWWQRHPCVVANVNSVFTSPCSDYICHESWHVFSTLSIGICVPSMRIVVPYTWFGLCFTPYVIICVCTASSIAHDPHQICKSGISKVNDYVFVFMKGIGRIRILFSFRTRLPPGSSWPRRCASVWAKLQCKVAQSSCCSCPRAKCLQFGWSRSDLVRSNSWETAC